MCGAAQSVIHALQETIRPFGVLVMPTHSGDLSDPSGWHHPAVPEGWWEEIRHSMPHYDPEITKTRGVGAIPELFRTLPDVVRSAHPQLSFAAWGDDALDIIADHELDFGLGEASPLARIYDRDGWVLLLGVGYEKNTSFHLAEIRAEFPEKKEIPCTAPLSVDGHTRWKSYQEIDYDSSDFDALGRDFSKHYKDEIRSERVGYARALLFRQRFSVDFASGWFHRKRR